MKVPLSWLREYVDVAVAPEALAERLTMTGLEVEAIEGGAGTLGTSGSTREGGVDRQRLQEVVVSQIVGIEPHPRADRLVVCEVESGRGRHRIVCGATNMKVGDKVPLAFPGTRLRSLKTGEPFVLERTAVRGVVSEGMLCSAVELDLPGDPKGLMILAREARVGESLLSVLESDDVVFSIATKPNRPDTTSVYGIAREVAALLEAALKPVDTSVKEGGKPVEEWASVVVEAPDLCPRYVARVIEGARIAPSPSWMQRRLEQVGVRPINNVVDVTNYVMMEVGQPLHAFDYDKVAGRRIVVRRARPGERMSTLEGVERVLDDSMLVIADAQRAVAVAGVMGGANSEVEPTTKRVLLESACFNAASNRRTSRRLGLSSESSYRFERGVDPQMQGWAADRAARLIAELAGGEVQRGRIDVQARSEQGARVRIRPRCVRAVLGADVPDAEMVAILKRLQIPVLKESAETIEVEVPSFRVDLTREIDLIEEIIRLYGYERIPTPVSISKVIGRHPDPFERFAACAKKALTGGGFSEIIGCNLIGRETFGRVRALLFDEEVPCLEVRSAKNPQLSVVRPTLIPGLLEIVGHNHSRRREDLRLFEIGHVHTGGSGSEPVEKTHLALALSGRRAEGCWEGRSAPVDFSDLKGAVEALCTALRVSRVRFEPGAGRLFRAGHAARVVADGRALGTVGEVARVVSEAFGIRGQLFVAEIDFAALFEVRDRERAFVPLPLYPESTRDIAIVVEESVPFEEVQRVFERQRNAVLRSARLFDVYRGAQIGSGRKSLAFSVVYRSDDRTLTDEEVDRAHDGLRKALREQLRCEIREG